MNTHTPNDTQAKRHSAIEVAFGLALAGAVCGLISLGQQATATPLAENNTAQAASAGSGSGGNTGGAGAGNAGSGPGTKPQDSVEVAMMLRQRTTSNLLVEEGR